MITNEEIQIAHDIKRELSENYNVPISSIVWAGKNKFIICKAGGREITINVFYEVRK